MLSRNPSSLSSHSTAPAPEVSNRPVHGCREQLVEQERRGRRLSVTTFTGGTLVVLKNARSPTARVFTTREQAHNHCQVGNVRLVRDVILDGVEFQTRAARSLVQVDQPTPAELAG